MAFQHLIKYGEMTKVHGRGNRKTRPCVMALLSTELLYCVEVGQARLELKSRIQLSSLEVEDIADEKSAPTPEEKPFQHQIGIKSPNRSFVAFCDSAYEKAQWLKCINKALAQV